MLRDIHEGHLSIENANHKQSNLAIKLQNIEKGARTLDKNLDKISTHEPTESEVAKKATKAKTKSKIFSLKLHKIFLNEIKNDEKSINEQIFNI